MIYFLKQVASNYGVLDDSDGVVEWVSIDELREYVNGGVEIQGVDKELRTLKRQTPTLDAKLCNWNGGESIFTTAKWFKIDWEGKFKLRAGDKTYKGQLVLGGADGMSELVFSYGVKVPIKTPVALQLRNGSAEEALEALKFLVT